MSLLINGVDMPTSCFNCRFCYLFEEYCDDEVYWISTKVYKCKVIEKSPVFEREDDLINGKLLNCPLTEIPTPHGRLIDADAYQYSGDLIDEPTIIEAEQGDG